MMIFKIILLDSSLGPCCEIALKWVSQNLTNDKVVVVSYVCNVYISTLYKNGQYAALGVKLVKLCNAKAVWMFSNVLRQYCDILISKLFLRERIFVLILMRYIVYQILNEFSITKCKITDKKN